MMQQQEEGTKIIIKGMSGMIEKVTDILREISAKCNDIKSDTELIKEYTSQIEDLFTKLDKVEEKSSKNNQKLLRGEDVKRYTIDFSEKYIPITAIKKKELYSSPKIVIRQLGDSINAMVDLKENFVTIQAIYNVKLIDDNYDYYAILGIINSKMMNFYYNIMYKEKELFPRILLENIKDLPIPLDLKENQEKISKKVQQLIEKKEENESIEKLETEINSFIFNLYNLEINEIEYITNLMD